MNTITKQTLIEAGKLATIYAWKLRNEGYTATKSRAVSPDKFMRCEFQNGALYKFTLPMGKLADWAALVETAEIDFSADQDKGTLTLRAGNSCVVFRNQTETTEDGLFLVSPIYFNDGNAGRDGAELKLIAPAGLENLTASLKAQKAQGNIDKLRGKEVNAKRDLKAAAAAHCARLAILAGGTAPAIARAHLIVKAVRMLRRALAAPLGVIPWLGETIEPAGEYDAGPISHFTPEHRELIGGIIAARADYQTWGNDKRFSYRGPKSIKLREIITRAEDNLNRYIDREFRAEMEKNSLPAPFVYWTDGKCVIRTPKETREYSRARIAVRDWTSRKWQLAQAYVETRAARIKAENKAVADGVLLRAKAIHADGKQTFAVMTTDRLQANIATARDCGAQVVILESNIANLPAGPVDMNPQPAPAPEPAAENVIPAPVQGEIEQKQTKETDGEINEPVPADNTGGATLGPWEVRELDNDKVIPTFTITGKTKRGSSFYVAKVDRRADAVLIAAAPELLSQLDKRAGNLETAAEYLKLWRDNGATKPKHADTPSMQCMIDALELCAMEARDTITAARGAN